MAISLTQMSAADKAAAASVDDIRHYERVPIDERIAEESVYDLVCNAADTWGDSAFMQFLPHGLANDAPVEMSFEQFKREVTKAANALWKLGTRSEDAVGFLAPNLPKTFVCLLAASTVGRANPVNPFLSVDHIVSIMRAAGVKIIATVGPETDAETFAKANDVADALGDHVSLLTLDNATEGVSFLSDEMAGCADNELTGFSPPSIEDISGIFHTGGTTSDPKLIAMTHRNQLATTCMGLLGSGYQPGDVSLAGLPTYHVIGGIATPLVSVAAGVSILLCGPSGFRNPFMIGDFWNIVSRHGVTTAAVVPTILSVLKDLPITDDISSLKQILSGAAPLSVALIEAVRAVTDAEIVETYGMTEASTFCARNPVDGEKRPGSVGPFVPYQEAKFLGEEKKKAGQEVTPGSVGRIVLRGPNIVGSTAFPRADGTTAGEERVDDDGWLDTGDLGRQDDEGYVWLQGRSKDLIIRSGHNIDPGLIEEALSTHPAVNMVAAVGQPDDYAGEVPIAFVALSPGQAAAPEDLLAYAREQVSERPAAPSRVEILDALPLTAIGKIYKPELRKRASEFVAGQIISELLPRDRIFNLSAAEVAPGARRPIEINAECTSEEEFSELVKKASSVLDALNFDPIFSMETPK